MDATGAAIEAAPPCAYAVASASNLTATALFTGAVSCSQEGRKEDTNFLMILGQIRAMADLTIFVPADDSSRKKGAELYSEVYYRFGGLGFDDVYRDQAKVDALERRVRQTDLSLTRAYDPGWQYRPSSKTDIYATVLSNIREQRVWQMRNMALELQNDEYYSAYKAEQELRRRNPVFQEGSPALEEDRRLTARMERAGKHIRQLPLPTDTTPYARLNEQDPEMAKRQVAVGFNGPSLSDTYLFRSEVEVRKSWLARVLSRQELNTLLGKADFSKQVLVAYSFGKRTNASGKIVLADLRYEYQGYTIATRIGVVPDSCRVRETASYPFVVGVTDAFPNARVTGFDTSNFPDKCGPIVSGEPSAQQ
jgi:hypothetical protein